MDSNAIMIELARQMNIRNKLTIMHEFARLGYWSQEEYLRGLVETADELSGRSDE